MKSQTQVVPAPAQAVSQSFMMQLENFQRNKTTYRYFATIMTTLTLSILARSLTRSPLASQSVPVVAMTTAIFLGIAHLMVSVLIMRVPKDQERYYTSPFDRFIRNKYVFCIVSYMVIHVPVQVIASAAALYMGTAPDLSVIHFSYYLIIGGILVYTWFAVSIMFFGRE